MVMRRMMRVRWVLAVLVAVAALGVELPGAASAAQSQVGSGGVTVPPLVSETPVSDVPAVADRGEWQVGPKGVTADKAAQFVAPTSSTMGQSQDLSSGDRTPVTELVGERSATSETWLNSDGTRSMTSYREPKFFQAAGSKEWSPIDSSLVADEAHPGWVRNAANSWSARFGPLVPGGLPGESGVVTESGAESLSFTPEAMAVDRVDPVVDAKAGTVTYVGVWPNVDVRYTVTAGAVKEDLVVNGPTDRASFRFLTSGAGLSPDRSEHATGGLVSDGAGGIRVAAPTVQAKDGADATVTAKPVLGADDVAAGSAAAPDAGGKAPVAGRSLSVSVDAGWLGGLKADEFPVTIDPTTVFNANPWYSYASNGYSCSYPCGIRVGNSQYMGDLYWRGVGYFPYESLIDNHRNVLSATVNLALNAGTANPWQVDVCWASAYSWGGACDTGAWGAGVMWSNPIDIDVTNLFQHWVSNGIRGGALGFYGDPDQPGLYTYKDLWSSVTVVYNTPPPKPIQNTPVTDSVLSTMSPAFAMTSGGADADGDTVYYGFSIGTSTDGLGGAVMASGLSTSPTWTLNTPGALRDGQTYYWRGYTYDGVNLTFSDAAFKFKVDMRLGAGGPSPTDAAGPVQVNLATGNVTTSVSTPSLSTVGGSVGVSLTYNSLAPKPKGLIGSYQWDGNNNQVFDEDVKMTRLDPQVSFDWGTGGPGPAFGGDYMLVRWTGYITPPTGGSWDFGTISDDGVRMWVDGVQVRNDWNDQGASPTVEWGGAVNFGSTPSPRPIIIEYYEKYGNSSIRVFARQTGSGTQQELQSSWLSPDNPAVPQGWTMSVGDSGVGFATARTSDSSVVLVASDGSSFEYKKTTGANGVVSYAPPAGFDDVLSANPDGTLTLAADDGNTYVFGASGELLKVTSVADDLHPAATTYTWGGTPIRLSTMTDPVAGRTANLTYGGGSCPSASGFSAPPAGMLCKVAFWDGTETDYFYSNGQIARVVNPGGATTDYGYDANANIITVRDPLANDAYVNGVRTEDTTNYQLSTRLTYAGGKVTSVKAPEPLAGGARPLKNYAYGAGTTSVEVAGITSSVTFDAANRQLTATDATGKTTTKTWDAADRPTSTVDPAGIKNATTYDTHGWATDTYGPAPASAFGSAPHATTSYDDGIQGLAATYWDNATLTGSPKRHGTGGVGTTDLNQDWGAAPPMGMPATWSMRLTGDINLTATGTYNFATWAKSGVRVYIDDVLVVDAWTDPGSGRTRSVPPDGTFNNTVANSSHRLRVDLTNTAGDSSVELWYLPPGGGWSFVPNTVLKPRYGLATTTTDASGKVTTTSYSASNNIGPEFGLPTTVTQNPSGLNLATTTSYETPGSTTYLRRTAKTLPAGAASAIADVYYGNTEQRTNPCPGGASNVVQGGRLKMSTDADPDGAGTQKPIEHESIYDAAGRVVASRTAPNGTAGVWVCTSYDTRGRPATVSYPAYGVDTTGRTVTYNYAVGGNPFVTSVTDPTGTITTTTDLLGRVVSYVDVFGKTTTTAYDLAGRVTTATTAGVPATSYTYDNAGRIETMSLGGKLIADPSYDSAGRMSSVAYPSGTSNLGNGTSGTFSYDTNGRPAGVTWTGPGSTAITSDQITARDVSGRITDQSTDGTDPYTGANYVYDAAGRLTTAHVSGHNYTYNYAATNTCGTATAAGKNTNRTSMVDNSTTTGYCYDNADRITSSTDTAVGTVAYDDHGNSTSIFGETHGYDAADRHLSTVKGSTTVTYARDATDRIVERKLNGTVVARYSSSAGGDTPDLTLDGANNVIEQTVVLPGGAMYTNRPATGGTWTNVDPVGDCTISATGSTVDIAVPAGDHNIWNGAETGCLATQPQSGDLDMTVHFTSDPRTDWQEQGIVVKTSTGGYGLFDLSGADNGNGLGVYAWAAASNDGNVDGSDVQVNTKIIDSTAPASQWWARVTRVGNLWTYWVSQDGTNYTQYASFTWAVTVNSVGIYGGNGGPAFNLHADILTGGPSSGSQVWSYPNLHGDYVATADGTGAKQGATTTYDPYGSTTAGTVPDNSAGSMDYGWLGKNQRPLEQQAGLQPVIEMGARQYSTRLGRFIEQDPIEGGSANDYDYCTADPINCTDLAGTWGWSNIKKWGRDRVKNVVNTHKQMWNDVKAAGRWTGKNWRTVTLVAGAVACVAASFGTCLGVVAAGFAARSIATLRTRGWSSGAAWRSVGVDFAASWASVALVAAPLSLGGLSRAGQIVAGTPLASGDIVCAFRCPSFYGR
jgi:RHS repeat-associated protein